MPALDDVLNQRLSLLEQQKLKRSLLCTDRALFPEVEVDGKPLISFACNDYLGLSNHKEVIQAVSDALKLGGGAGASRLVSGHHSLCAQLECILADLKYTQAALLFGSGYLANIGTIPALMGKQDLIVSDKLIHACMLDGIVLSGAAHKRFAHNNLEHLEELLKKHRDASRHCLITTETVFSMDGDRAPLEAICELAKRYDAWVMTDDAHGFGIAPSVPVDIQMGTLSKAVGVYGGYICGSQALIDTLVSSARSFMFTTALPVSVVAAAVKSLEIIREEPERGQRALENARYFTDALNLPIAQSCIVPMVIGEAELALQAARDLAEDGFWVSAIRPPTVPVGSSRLRFTFSTLHSKQQIDGLIESIKQHGWLENFKHQWLDTAC